MKFVEPKEKKETFPCYVFVNTAVTNLAYYLILASILCKRVLVKVDQNSVIFGGYIAWLLYDMNLTCLRKNGSTYHLILNPLLLHNTL